MKTSTDYARERGIANALAHLVLDLPKLPPELLPLVEAAQSGDWQGIANAALQHANPALLDEHFALCRLRWIAATPEAFGLTEMTKSDVSYIFHLVQEGPSPPNMKEAWKRAGLDHLPQGKGNPKGSDSGILAAYASWKRKKASEIEALRRG